MRSPLRRLFDGRDEELRSLLAERQRERLGDHDFGGAGWAMVAAWAAYGRAAGLEPDRAIAVAVELMVGCYERLAIERTVREMLRRIDEIAADEGAPHA